MARLWSKIGRRGPDECWSWSGARSGDGYGQLRVAGRTLYTHRLIEALVRGPLSPGCVVRHSCDNPPCCNPAHLLRGTHADNTRDAIERGRFNAYGLPGERNGNAVLTDAGVMAIRRGYAGGATQLTLASCYGVARSLVASIVSGASWSHLPTVPFPSVHGPGLCACGCGRRAPIAKMKWIQGHSGRRAAVA